MAVHGFTDVETAFKAFTERPTEPADAERLLRDDLILQTCVTVLGMPDMKRGSRGELIMQTFTEAVTNLKSTQLPPGVKKDSLYKVYRGKAGAKNGGMLDGDAIWARFKVRAHSFWFRTSA
jgi:hypothetical protein